MKMNIMKYMEIDLTTMQKTTLEGYVSRLKSCLEDRLDWLNDREPESEGSVYDTWEVKCSDLEDIIDDLDDINFEGQDEEDIIIDIKDVINDIAYYQRWHGGLSRLNVQ